MVHIATDASANATIAAHPSGSVAGSVAANRQVALVGSTLLAIGVALAAAN
ncbi:MAG: MFS transporter, partial [Saccharothrix sp.]|nr:MFS transporter [Saccharothrix sp.]